MFRLPWFCTRMIFAVAAAAGGSAPAFAQTSVVPRNLSVGQMFVQADWIVKLVIIGLMIASLITWTVLIAKSIELRKAKVAEQDRHDAVLKIASLDEARSDARISTSPLAVEAIAELILSKDVLGDADGVKERIISRFERHEAAVARRLTRGVSTLATIGATAPFVGLFGTVWGIMNSFIGIAEKQTTNLAVVAPGIAEALLATALGLVAAIPAVVIYNHFARAIAAHRALVADTAAALLRLVSRDLSRGAATGRGF